MNLQFDLSLAEGYKSSSQITRRLTEAWIENNMYCPRCGNLQLDCFGNNRPVADFFCPKCANQFELKSTKIDFHSKITDGSYETMIKRINSNSNPDFFFMSYLQKECRVNSLMLVPKHFFVPNLIEKRNPLSVTARRAGWVGCNILVHKIPEQCKIHIINSGISLPKNYVVERTNRSQSLKTEDIHMRGWLMDVLTCINQTMHDVFSLDDIYCFESMLSAKYPDNKNIKPKIRQQLQFLRDKGYIEFLGRGRYKKIL